MKSIIVLLIITLLNLNCFSMTAEDARRNTNVGIILMEQECFNDILKDIQTTSSEGKNETGIIIPSECEKNLQKHMKILDKKGFKTSMQQFPVEDTNGYFTILNINW